MFTTFSRIRAQDFRFKMGEKEWFESGFCLRGPGFASRPGHYSGLAHCNNQRLG